MIALLRGVLRGKSGDSVIVETGGIGYQIFIPANSSDKLPEVGGEIELNTVLYVRDDILQLYGFVSLSEKEMFLQLISVNKIGPKSALAALSAYSTEALTAAIMRNDVELVSSVPGIGKKTAQRLIWDLKDKIMGKEVIVEWEGGDKVQEARNALVELGYSLLEANRAIGEIKVENDSSEELLKKALQLLGKEKNKA